VSAEGILAILREAPDLQTAAARLVAAANAAGAPDNVTALLVRT
jgi:serine/threonine protein phosphatase PrpC